LDAACPPDLVRLADTVRLLHVQMLTLADHATADERAALKALLAAREDGQHG
jgi:hypothetical protein